MDEEKETKEDKQDDAASAKGSDEPMEEDDVVEFVFNDDGEEDVKATLKKLRKDLKAERTKAQEYLTSWQRERADFTNYKKEDDTRRQNFIRHAKEHFAEEILPVLDSYDMAFSNKEAWEKVDKNWRMGVEYIHQQLLKVLAENGVEEIPVKTGDSFDPNIHQPIETIETEDKEKDHTIERVTQKGYRSQEKTLRPARVNVYAFK